MNDTLKKILFKNAKIYDGDKTEAFFGDVLIQNEKILEVAPEIAGDNECEIVDLKGLSIAPGFIDAHSHNDWFALRQNKEKYFEPFIRQGITTFVSGNCGLGATGFLDETVHTEHIGGGLFSFKDAPAIGGLGKFLDAIDSNIPCNMSVLAGHCTARASVSGNSSQALGEDELNKMLEILENSLKEGAAGISLGLMYSPGMYAPKDELKAVARLCEKYNRPLTVHPRANSAVSMAYPRLLGRSHLLRALDELAEIVEGTKTKLHYSHAIFVGRRSFKDKDEFIKITNRLCDSGVDMMFDIYNETQGVSVITVILPTWYQAMSRDERKKPLTRLKLSLLVRASSLLLGFGFKDIQVAHIGDGFGKYEGKTVHQIARMEGISCLKAYLMLCERSNFKGRVNMGPYTTPDIIHSFEKDPRCLYMTDAWVEDDGVQNPAIYDCFPKFLQDSILGMGDSPENTIHKMTGATAKRFGMENRGFLKAGCYADITIFSEEEIANATFDGKCSFGIKGVWINGKNIFDGKNIDYDVAKSSGRAIRIK